MFYSLLQNHEDTKDLIQSECRLNNIVHFNLLRVIELLKKGRACSNEIKNYIDSRMIYKQCFTDNLEEYVGKNNEKKRRKLLPAEK